MASARELFDTLSAVAKLLTDPEMSSIRLVMTPERMVIKETQRTYTYLNLYGYATDAIVVNRIIPDTVTDPYFDRWKAIQQENMQLITEAFGQLRRLEAPLFETDVGGLDSLRRLGDALYGDLNPAQILTPQSAVHHIEQDEKTDDYLLKIPLPFVQKGDLDVYRSADELTIRVGPYRRNIVLPYALWKMEIGNAKFIDGGLLIRFVNKNLTPMV
jgi:arsenite-transporting ATPase